MPVPFKSKAIRGSADAKAVGSSPEHARPADDQQGLDWGTVDRADTLAVQAYTNIKTSLMSGQLAPGERLSMRHIAEVYAISLTPARDALARLAAERALDVDPRRTFRVPVLNRTCYRELLAIRLLLEGHATQTAAGLMDRATVANLEALNARFADAIARRSVKESLELNRLFHFTIYKAANMPELFGIVEGLWVRIGPSLNLLHPEYQRGRRGLHNHVAASQAMRAGDGEAAKSAIQRDLIQGAEHILKFLDD